MRHRPDRLARSLSCALACTLAATLGHGCSSAGRDEDLVDFATSGDSDESTTVPDDPTGPRLDVGDGTPTAGDPEGGECMAGPGGPAHLAGRVFAPNGELPIAGALVSVQAAPPEGIPDHVYCEECIVIDCDIPHTVTRPDGSFDLDVPEGEHYLVIQKGQFLKATLVTAHEGEQWVVEEDTTLPSRRSPADLTWTPNVALAWGDYDRLEDGLAKLGLGQTEGGSVLVPGTEAFDVWSNASNSSPAGSIAIEGTFSDLLHDPDAMSQYHIIFVPCTSSPHEDLLADPQVLDNIRQWVAKGGKWYVSDWSLAFLDRPFDQYQTFWIDAWTGLPLLDEFDTTGTVLDEDLLAWLQALPAELADINALNPGMSGHPTLAHLPEIELVDLWSTIKATPPVIVDDGEGGTVDVGHKVWIQAPGGGGDGAPADVVWPMTVTGEYGCGRILFTSYHTVEWTDPYVGLTPQELVLSYLIMELGVCQIPFSVPPVG